MRLIASSVPVGGPPMSFSDAAARLKKARADTQAAIETATAQATERPPEKPVDFKELYLLRARIVGVLIRDARLARGRTVEACAEALAIAPETLVAWELGEATPDLPVLEILANYLDVPISHFWSTQTLTRDGKTGFFAQEEYVALRQRIIGLLLRKARTDAGLSLEDLATRSGLSAEQLNAYELGQQPIPLVELMTLASATNVSLRYFLDEASRIGRWLEQQEDFKRFSEMPDAMRAFLSNPVNASFVELAMWLRQLDVDELRGIGEMVLTLTRLKTEDLRSIAEGILNITY
jgi:transcriptional regulator with XRE-family HTH domain